MGRRPDLRQEEVEIDAAFRIRDGELRVVDVPSGKANPRVSWHPPAISPIGPKVEDHAVVSHPRPRTKERTLSAGIRPGDPRADRNCREEEETNEVV